MRICSDHYLSYAWFILAFYLSGSRDCKYLLYAMLPVFLTGYVRANIFGSCCVLGCLFAFVLWLNKAPNSHLIYQYMYIGIVVAV
jgi:hypothetical protein